MKLIIFGVVILVVIGVAVLVLFPSLLPFDTKYTPGYTQSAFRSIHVGDAETTVITRLGPAFATNACEPFIEWIYSADKQPHFHKKGEGSGTYTSVTFKRGSVAAISGMTLKKSTLFSQEMTFGEGAGYLKLNLETRDGLKGKGPDFVKEKLGVPLDIYESKATKSYSYSRASSGGNYWLREIRFDAAGKVVAIEKSMYWD